MKYGLDNTICLWKDRRHHEKAFSPLQNPFNPFPNKPCFLRVFNTGPLKTLGKGEIAGNEQFLLFPVFSTAFENFLSFSSGLKLSSANSLSSEESKICRLGKG